MSLKHTWTQQIKNDAGAAVASDNPQIIYGEAEVNFYVEVPFSTTEEVDVAITVADIQSGFLWADKAVKICTNDETGATGQVINLAAGKAFAWNADSVFANPFDPDITKFYIENEAGSGADAKVRGGFLVGVIT